MRIIKFIKVLLILSQTLLIYMPLSVADSVTDWHAFAVKTIGDKGSRTFAIVQAAVFDAVNGITPKYHFYKVKTHAPEANIDAAVAAASATVLLELEPDKKNEINVIYTKSLKAIPDSPQKEAGVAHGKNVANEILKLRQDDGYDREVSYHAESKPGVFQPPEGKEPTGMEFPFTTPFAMKSASQFRLDPPPTLTSPSYGRDVNEVQSMGSKDSKTRTKDQTEIAHFWDANSIITWNMIANYEARDSGRSEIDNARSFAILDFAIMDAQIANIETKYHYKFWRPIEAIRRAGEIENTLIKPDPNWTPLEKTPTNPEYGSTHAATAGAASYVLTNIYGTHPVNIKTEAASGQTRPYKNFKDAANDTALARIYIGYHFRNSCFKGLQIGEEVGQYVVENTLLPLEAGH